MVSQAYIQLTLQAVVGLPRLEDEEEFLYGHLSQCVLAAVYSLGATATSERNVVHAYSHWADLSPFFRPSRQAHLPQSQQEPLDWFLSYIQEMGPESFATNVLHNRQLTAPRGGILKSLSAMQLAEVLVAWNVLFMQDVIDVAGMTAFERMVRKISGLKSGIGLTYFYMLVGSEEFVKPDRHVTRFLERTVGHTLHRRDIQRLISTIAPQLGLTPRQVDNIIWNYQRAQSQGDSNG
jgi:thermostable 8-oxoguanine DNA glycosylase